MAMNSSVNFPSFPCDPEFHIDKVEIYTLVPYKRLSQILPVTLLRSMNPEFYTRQVDGKGGYLSLMGFSAPSVPFLELLMKHEDKLWAYDIYLVELAYDFPGHDEEDVRRLYDMIVPRLQKKWWKRKKIVFVGGENGNGELEGYITGRPTAYWEDRKSSTGLKVYCRYSKVTGKPVLRVEFTLRGAGNIKVKTGIHNLIGLLYYDSIKAKEFIRRYLAIVDFNPRALSRWALGERQFRRWEKGVGRRTKYSTPNPELTGYKRYLMIMAARDAKRNGRLDDFDHYLQKWKSPAYVRGRLMRDSNQIRRKRGRRTGLERKLAKLTPYKINSFFINH